ncbi:MAG: hypothetical protein WA002_06495 [Candidatus Acidiferrales bacterium]
MNPKLKKFAISGLRWALGVVVVLESLHFALSVSAAHHFAGTGLPRWIRPALGGSEAIAAILFLVPAASMVGGYLLLFIFAVAAVIHVLHGDFDVGSLIIYGIAVIVCMTHRNRGAVRAPDENASHK